MKSLGEFKSINVANTVKINVAKGAPDWKRLLISAEDNCDGLSSRLGSPYKLTF